MASTRRMASGAGDEDDHTPPPADVDEDDAAAAAAAVAADDDDDLFEATNSFGDAVADSFLHGSERRGSGAWPRSASHLWGEVRKFVEELDLLSRQDIDNASLREKLAKRRASFVETLKERRRQLAGAPGALGRGARKAVQKVQEVRRRAITGDKDKRVRDYVKMEVPGVRLVDKISFTLGVLGLNITQLVLVSLPGWFGLWYMVTMPLLLAIRYVSYKREGYLGFLADFCYFSNALCMLAYFYPHSPTLMQTIFVYANGPLVWAIVLWRNSLVFHSLDKITSLFIHLLPGLITFLWRWYPLENHEISPMCTDSTCKMSFSKYMFWQALYMFVTEYVHADTFQADPTQQTSLRWLSRSKGGMAAVTKRTCRKLGIMGPEEEFDSETWKTKWIFMTTQFIYTLVCFLPCKFVFESQTLHLAYLIFVWFAAVWNGACFYIEAFSSRYQAKFEKLMQRQRANSGASVGSTDGTSSPPPITDPAPSSPGSAGGEADHDSAEATSASSLRKRPTTTTATAAADN